MAYDNKCMYCFEDLGGRDICPHCGHDSRAAVPQIQLLPGTLLHNGRFLVGRAMGQDASGIVYMAYDTKREATLRIRVQDGHTGADLPGAEVVIAETGEHYHTDEQGYTPDIPVPILRDTRYDQLHPQEWGEISVLAYCEGYEDYALFHLQVEPGQARTDPVVMMFERDQLYSQPFALVEGPKAEWVQELLDRFRPR